MKQQNRSLKNSTYRHTWTNPRTSTQSIKSNPPSMIYMPSKIDDKLDLPTTKGKGVGPRISPPKQRIVGKCIYLALHHTFVTCLGVIKLKFEDVNEFSNSQPKKNQSHSECRMDKVS